MPATLEPTRVNWTRLRDDFPVLDQEVHGRPLVYLDNGATTQKPRMVLEAMQRYYEHDNANVHRGIHELSNRATAAYEAARARAATFINARSADEIVFTRGTTEGLNLVANAWGMDHLKPGDRIVLTEMEHHSNIVPWQLVAKKTGAKLTFIPVTGDIGLLDLSSLDSLLDGAKVLSLMHISNSLGTINPVAEICARAKAFGVTTIVDAAQSAGHRPLDVQQIGADFLVFSGHKMCGPTGIGVLYGRQELLEEMSPYQGGGEMIVTVDFQESTWKHGPHKFEAGTPNMAGAVGLHAAMDYLDGIGRDVIAHHDQELGAYAFARLAEFKNSIRLFGPHVGRAGLVSFLLNEIHAHDVVTVADQKGVALRGGHHCNQPLMNKLGVASTARASFYFYNTKAEIDAFVKVLHEIQAFFTA